MTLRKAVFGRIKKGAKSFFQKKNEGGKHFFSTKKRGVKTFFITVFVPCNMVSALVKMSSLLLLFPRNIFKFHEPIEFLIIKENMRDTNIR